MTEAQRQVIMTLRFCFVLLHTGWKANHSRGGPGKTVIQIRKIKMTFPVSLAIPVE